ncbi:hypothetical protein IW140_004310 [Coemansia sp. RSA 1813]|nr:hypothetical protein EV178_004383 [Coemansia sp. RSA 1646]KAJ1767400.1 hypothetical protein LPJ74_005392 [Coemansia sp. RSA 1843]KAJ2087962.1 hypothetical protein IW138_004559 [Coemansia sp. RSA 986]KAJ2211270.1 hypothetical protein EV179_005634 [Coemansia sp. RSA 487]KAJ2567800.1 hypothetical protein IW140_004310 [Coemansia sp. RSA 1813]
MKQPVKKIVTVPLHADGLRVDRFVANRIGIPPNLLFKLLRKRAIAQVDNDGKIKRINGPDRVYPGMRLQIPTELVTIASSNRPNTSSSGGSKTDKETTLKFVSKLLPILYETKSFVVFNKPPGLACQGGSKIKYSIDMLLAKIDNSEEAGYRLVHRLDRETTGALAVAKTRITASTLARAFSDRTVEKEYIAVIKGIPKVLQGTITAPLVNTGTKTIAVTDVSSEIKPAKSAITKYKTLATGKFDMQDVAIVSLNILTGRKHQIRVHCAQVLGCPVLGDIKYNEPKDNIKRQTNSNMFLHLYRLSIPPDISVKAPFPRFWSGVFKQLNISFSNSKKTN